jgi:hypothetical protein
MDSVELADAAYIFIHATMEQCFSARSAARWHVVGRTTPDYNSPVSTAGLLFLSLRGMRETKSSRQELKHQKSIIPFPFVRTFKTNRQERTVVETGYGRQHWR